MSSLSTTNGLPTIQALAGQANGPQMAKSGSTNVLLRRPYKAYDEKKTQSGFYLPDIRQSLTGLPRLAEMANSSPNTPKTVGSLTPKVSTSSFA